MALLGKYYARLGAQPSSCSSYAHEESHQVTAIRHLTDAKKIWKELAYVASKHYANPTLFSTQRGVRWDKYVQDVERDIEITTQLGYSQPMVH